VDELEMRAFELEWMLLHHRAEGDIDRDYSQSIRKRIRELRAQSRTYTRLIFRQAA